ncbi:Carboxypeptidase S1 A [Cercospora beticola]|uniref:Carboxypeptidase n=1 Tax=Cercospora beticola TaxID=122368 RepID=A0A2G5HXZ3_CERBT|nr:Carboxypeptidase S1 A [Cercospora beticola]PIA97398.1 Carboxypeptidase S1 A [Cercospora beticola]WPA98047.1 hypothetical protein RHO25_002658 [Cercospora beticola]
MLGKSLLSKLGLLAATASVATASLGKEFHAHSKWQNVKRQYFPANATDVKSFTTPTNVTIRYKEPGKEGVCETTPGVNSYSGYIDIAPNVHVFFWFFESRRDPANDDLTLWLNGGPGSDSLIGLFEELGPCRITENLTSVLNPYSWNEVSNMLFLSQPVGVSFSNQGEEQGTYANYTGTFLNSTELGGVYNSTGTWPILDPIREGEIDTTDLAAIGAWHVFQGFLSALPSFANVTADQPKNFNLWTESYGGHYGPSFFRYFSEQNDKIANGTLPGYHLNFRSLGLINAIISEKIQIDYYPEFAVNNTYGIQVYNDTVYNYAKFATNMVNGCKAQIDGCIASAQGIPGGLVNGKITYAATSQPAVAAICAEAGNMCRDNVESLYYAYGDRGTYDIRHPSADPTPESYFGDYLNQAKIQNAIGVSLNYTTSNTDIYFQFQSTGDYIYPNFLEDLEEILNSGVRVALMYGDADYICNWFGGEAVSKEVNYTYTKEFNAAGYEPFVWGPGKVQAGETREYGNFSFTRIYEAGHEIPYYQPGPSLAMFERVISGLAMSDGAEPVTANLTTTGNANTTHTANPADYSLPPTASADLAAYSSSLIASYASLDNAPPPTAVAKMLQV